MEQNSATNQTGDASGPRLYALSSLIDQAIAEAELRAKAKAAGEALGPVTPSRKLTEALGGYLSPGPHILHGNPGSGKTAFALQLAATCGAPAVYVSCEMQPVELLRRIASRVTGEYLGKFKNGEMSIDKARALFVRAAESAARLSIVDATYAPLSPSDLNDMLNVVADRFGAPPVFVIDSVHAWVNGWRTDATEYDALNGALESIRQIAFRLGSPALAIAERNRASRETGGQAAAAGSRRFEYGAESVIELQRGEESQDALGDIPVMVKLSKNRHGELVKEIKLQFNGRTQRFTEA